MYIRNLISLIGILFFGNYLVGRVNADCQFTTNANSEDEWSGCTANSFIHKAAGSACTSGNACTTEELTETTEHIIYYCSSATSCEELLNGYYFSSTDVYSCGATGTCKKITPATASACTGKTGEVIKVSNALKFCPDATAAPVAIAANAGDYVVAYANPNVFGIGDGEYGVVTISDKSIKINTSASPTYTDSTSKAISDLSTLTCTGTFKVLDTFSSGLGSAATLTITSGNYLLVKDSTNNIYCMATYDGTNIQLSSVTDGNFVVGAVVDTIFYPVLTETDLATVTIGNVKLLKCTSSNGACPFADGYILYGTAGTASSSALCNSTDGTCTANTGKGYFVNALGGSNSYIECTTTCGTATLSDECKDETIGKLIDNDGDAELCLDGTTSIGFLSESGTKYYLVSYGAQSVFVDSVVTEKYGIVEVTGISMKISTKTSVCVNRSSLEVTDKTNNCGDGEKERSCTAGVCDRICDVSNGDDCDVGKFYLVDGDGARITTGNGHLHLCTSSTAACPEKTAKGYYIYDKDTLYSCDGTDNGCKAETALSGTSCTSSNIGSLFYDSTDNTKISVCLNHDGTSAIDVELKADAGDYIVASGTVYGISTDQFAVVTIDANSVTVKTIAADGYYLASSSTLALVTANNGEGDLYECVTGTNICTAVSTDIPVGYLINGGNGGGNVPYIKCTDPDGTEKCKAIAVAATACSAAKTGGLIVDGANYKLCLNDGTTTVELSTTITASTYYVISISGDGNVFGQATDKYVIIDVKDGNAILEDLTGKGGNYIANTSTQAILTTAGDGTIYDCDATSSQCTKPEITVGYYKNADTTATAAAAIPYIQCSSTQCSGIGISETSCSAATIGKLIKDTATPPDIKLCISATTADAATLATAGQYMVSVNVDNSIFGSKSDNYVVVDLDGNGTVALVSIANDGYYIAADTTYKLASADTNPGLLYSCTASTKNCSVIPNTEMKGHIGYTVNAGDTATSTIPYIKCVAGTGDAVTCTAIAASADCSTAGIGGLIEDTTDGVKYKLCLDTSSKSVELVKTADTITEYIVGVDGGNVFGDEDDSFVIVDVSKGNALLHGKEESPDRYEFADSTGARIDKSNFSTSNCESGALKSTYSVTEYKLNEEAEDTSNNYYTAV